MDKKNKKKHIYMVRIINIDISLKLNKINKIKINYLNIY